MAVSKRDLKVLLSVGTLASVLLILGFSFLSSSSLDRVTTLGITGMGFGGYGWVTFYLRSYYGITTTINRVSAAILANNTALGSVSLFRDNVVPAGGAFNLTVQFPGVTWQPSVRYQFSLTDAKNYTHFITQCPNTC